MLTVNEIFYSIQGESTRAGQPCVFVRLTAARFTMFVVRHGVRILRGAQADPSMRWWPLSSSTTVRSSEITGGEPLLQEDVYDLMNRLPRKWPDGAARNGRPSSDR